MRASNQHGQPPDLLVDEVRRIRADISAQFGHDVGRLTEHLREIERHENRPILEPRSGRSAA